MLAYLKKLLHLKIAYAHCDIPCGIYTPEPARVAARTVARMVELLEELELPKRDNKKEMLIYHNKAARMVHTKEEHAQICKKELLILWTDYFKKEHLQMFPNLHETFWKATKLCSKNKQEVDAKLAKELQNIVEEIANMFQKLETAKHKH